MNVETPIEFDLTRPTVFRHGHPFPVYDRLRRDQPVYRNPEDGNGRPIWVLTRHADVECVARDNRRFTSTQGFRVFEQGGMADLKPHIRDAITSTLLTMDPPEHASVRRPMQGHFLPSALRRLEGQVNGFVDEMVAALPADSEIDFVTRVASVVPIRTLCLLLDIPEADHGKHPECSEDGGSDKHGAPSEGHPGQRTSERGKGGHQRCEEQEPKKDHARSAFRACAPPAVAVRHRAQCTVGAGPAPRRGW